MADGLRPIRRKLIAWYDANRRDLPWRAECDAYGVWVSETMLQQTTVGVVVPYFNRWMSALSTVEALAASSEQEVLSLWQGLGYYRRAKNLRLAAQRVVQEGWPTTYEDWIGLPGVGPYTAGAVCSIAFGLETPAVDGNVERVFARLACSSSKMECISWARTLVVGERPGDLVQALMELGATVCLPRNPACTRCPLKSSCQALRSGRIDEFPSRVTKKQTVKLEKKITVAHSEGWFCLRKIGAGEWWEGMYEFCAPPRAVGIIRLGTFKHTVTNNRITVTAELVQARSRSRSYSWYSATEIEQLPLPAPQRRAADMALTYLAQSAMNASGLTREPSSAKK